MTDQPKWTPGPWVIKGQTSEGASFLGTMHRIHGDDAWISFVPTWDSKAKEELEAEANAHLIAAAPDLYAALEMAQLWLSVDGRFDMQGINAALAKARGQA